MSSPYKGFLATTRFPVTSRYFMFSPFDAFGLSVYPDLRKLQNTAAM